MLNLTRTIAPTQNELFFLVEDSNGQTIPIKQTFNRLEGGQIRFSIEAGQNVRVFRGELLKQGNESKNRRKTEATDKN